MARPKQKRIPEFTSEDEERRFWETSDSTDYVDWAAGERVLFENLRPSTETISLRLPAGLLADLKVLARKRDVPYQSLLKIFLAERVAREWRATGVPAGRGSGRRARTAGRQPGTKRRAG